MFQLTSFGLLRMATHDKYYTGMNPNYVTMLNDTLFIVNALNDDQSSLTTIRYTEKPPFISKMTYPLKQSHPAHIVTIPITDQSICEQCDCDATMLVSSLGSGSVTVLKREHGGYLTITDVFVGARLNHEGKEGIHGSFLGKAFPENAIVEILITGFLSDTVYIAQLHITTGQLSLIQTIPLTKNCGPRYITLNRDRSVAYMTCAKSGGLMLLQSQSSDSELSNKHEARHWTLVDSVTIPTHKISGQVETGNGVTTATAVALSEDERFLYASFMLQGDVTGKMVMFQLDNDERTGAKKLGNMKVFSTFGINPHDFALVRLLSSNDDESDSCVYAVVVVNSRTHSLDVIRRDVASGHLSDQIWFTQRVNSPSSIVTTS